MFLCVFGGLQRLCDINQWKALSSRYQEFVSLVMSSKDGWALDAYLLLVILATWKAEIRRIMVQSQPSK
jgi:hypothetical protein